MADTYVRTEGDYEIWLAGDAEYRRWAPGNSKGKQAKALAERHPKASEKARRALERSGNGHSKELTAAEFGRGMAAVKGEIQHARKQQAQAEAEEGLLRAAKSLSPLSPKLPAQAWGFIIEKQAELAMSPDVKGSVSAAELVGKATDYLGGKDKAGTQVQVNVVHMDAETWQLLDGRGRVQDVVEGEVREVE